MTHWFASAPIVAEIVEEALHSAEGCSKRTVPMPVGARRHEVRVATTALQPPRTGLSG